MQAPIDFIWMEVMTSTPVVGSLSALIGAVIVKLIDRNIQKGKQKTEADSILRSEMRKELVDLKARLDIYRKENDDLRAKYWKEVEDHNETRAILHKCLSSVEPPTEPPYDEPIPPV